MLQNLNISFASFARRTRERLDETVVATKGAMEAARERRRTCGGSIAAEVAHLTDRIAELEKLKTEFVAYQCGAPQAA